MSSSARLFVFFVIAVAVSIIIFTQFIPQHADTIFVNARFYTVDDESDIAEAMAMRGDRIVGIGTQGSIERRFTSDTIVDLKGGTVFPGFIDAHAHLMSLGIARMNVDLLGAATQEECAERVKAKLSKATAGQWIRGRGWDQNIWPAKKFPAHQVLDKVCRDNPVILSRVDGHAIWVNERAMEIAGITKATRDTVGGKIIRDDKGNPTGVFIDNATELVFKFLPPPTDEEAAEALTLAVNECLSVGLTEVHDMGIGWSEIDLYKRMIDSDKFPFRVYACVDGPGDTWEMMKKSGPVIGYGNNRLTIRGLKLYEDGALGSRGAALIEPYSDDPDNRGLTVTTEEDLQKDVDDAMANGFQVCTHAIGDRANHIVLDVYERALRHFPKGDYRLRIEHAQVLDPSDIPRFAKLGIIPSMQPTHCTSDMYWAEARLGPDRIRDAYAWRALLMTGVVIPGGSDFPVENPGPLAGIYAGVTRQDSEGRPKSAADVAKYFQLSAKGVTDSSAFENGWYASQKMTREEAVESFTRWAAWSAFEENIKGTLERGKLADFVVLSADIMKIPVREILTTQVLRTYIGGHLVYERK